VPKRAPLSFCSQKNVRSASIEPGGLEMPNRSGSAVKGRNSKNRRSQGLQMSGTGERFGVPFYPIFTKPKSRTTDFNIPITLSWEFTGSDVISFQFVEHL
jgi:hypothetical protein